MSARRGRTQCRVPGCSWWMASLLQLERDRAWSEHWRSVHANPTTLTTRCTAPACGWSTSSPDLDDLRRLRAEHITTTHEGTPTR